MAFEIQHKFSIVFENVWYSRVIEKIDMAFAAQTIPIYWGNPKVGELYNEKAFINCHNYTSFEGVVERIMEIDSDDELYLSMFKEPALLESMTSELYIEKLAKFLMNMIETPKREAIQRSTMGWTNEMDKIREMGSKKRYRQRKIKSGIGRVAGKIFNPWKNTKFAFKVKRKLFEM